MGLRHVVLALVAALLMPACIDDFEQVAVTVTGGAVLPGSSPSVQPTQRRAQP
jgi:hypothetical protein